MNYLWAGMLLVGIVYGCLTGKTAEITQAALDSAGEAISLCITMTGIMCFWVGMMRIAERAGMIRKMAAKMEPVLHFLFPDLRHETRAKEYIATNMIANIFGLGWAATPQTGENRTATKDMCTFLVINISSLQLIPVNMIAYRSQYGSADPTAIVGPAIIATCVSTLVAVAFCKIMQRGEGKGRAT